MYRRIRGKFVYCDAPVSTNRSHIAFISRRAFSLRARGDRLLSVASHAINFFFSFLDRRAMCADRTCSWVTGSRESMAFSMSQISIRGLLEESHESND